MRTPRPAGVGSHLVVAHALAALASGVATSLLTVAVARRGRPGVTSAAGRTAVPAPPEDTAGDPTTAGA